MSEYIHSIVDGIKSFLTGMGLTFKHFKEKKVLVATLQYPNEKWPKPERSIGFDHKDYNKNVIAINIGGISNMTYIPKK